MSDRAEVAVLHRVEGPPAGLPAGLAAQYCSPDSFESYLREREDFPRLRPSQLDLAEFDGPGWLITFDDGFRSVLDVALPMMEKVDVHAIVFVTNGFVSGENVPYETRLWELIAPASRWIDPDGRERILASDAQRARLYEELRGPLKPLNFRRRDAALQALAERNLTEPRQEASPPPGRTYLSWEEVRTLDRHPLITIGAHTRTHPQLNALGTLSAAREILRGKRELELELGHPVDWFAYPYGAHGRRSRALVRWAGFRAAFATADGDAGNPLALPRSDPWAVPA